MKDRLRILQLINVRWWNASAEYGVSLALGLHRRGHHVVVAGQEDSPPLLRAQALGLRIKAIGRKGRGPRWPGLYLADLKTLIRQENIQVLNAHRAEGHLLASLASAMFGRRIPVVRTRGDVRPPQGHLFNRWLHINFTDAVVLPAEALRKPVLDSLRRPPAILEVIPPGVDLACFSSGRTPKGARQALGCSKDDPVVGMVARLSPVKGHWTFLEAAKRVLQVFPRAYFMVVGGEAQLKIFDLQSFATRLGIAHRVRWTGSVDQVEPLVDAFDVAVVASQGSEVICRVALEYMAMSKPVVGTRVNAIPEVVAHGITGLLVPSGDAQAMSEAILGLLKNPQQARAMGRAGRRRVQQAFTLDHLAQRSEALYRRLLLFQ